MTGMSRPSIDSQSMTSSPGSSIGDKPRRHGHKDVPLTPEGRNRLIERCRTRPIAHVSAEMGISRATASKWVNRYRQFGRCPGESPQRTQRIRVPPLRHRRAHSPGIHRVARERAGRDRRRVPEPRPRLVRRPRHHLDRANHHRQRRLLPFRGVRCRSERRGRPAARSGTRPSTMGKSNAITASSPKSSSTQGPGPQKTSAREVWEPGTCAITITGPTVCTVECRPHPRRRHASTTSWPPTATPSSDSYTQLRQLHPAPTRRPRTTIPDLDELRHPEAPATDACGDRAQDTAEQRADGSTVGSRRV